MTEDAIMTIQEQTEADTARERVAATIDELQERLSPKRMLGDAVDRVQAQGSELVDQARDIVKSHPLAIGAVGLAIGLALFARSKIANATVDLGDDYRGYTDYDDNYGGEAPVAPVFEDEAPEDAAPRARRVAALSGTAETAVEGNPIVSIALGLAAGAVLGALFPATEREARLYQDTGTRLGRAARAAARSAKAELDAHGLSVESASRVAERAKASVRNIVTAVGDELKGPAA